MGAYFLKYQNTSNYFFSWYSLEMLRVKFCANRRKSHGWNLGVAFWSFRALVENNSGISGRGLYRRCSNDSCMCGYKIFGCAIKYTGVISVTDFAQKQRHLVVFLVCDMNVMHRTYNFSPAPTSSEK